VVRHLIDAERIEPVRLSAAGYADQRPLIPGTSSRANRLNRRVEIVVVSTLPPEDRALLPTIAPTVTQAG
jgi:chemotaxis protein MotB